MSIINHLKTKFMAIKKGTTQSTFRIPKNADELSERDKDFLSMGPAEAARKYKIQPQAVSARKNSLWKVFGKDFKYESNHQQPHLPQNQSDDSMDNDDGMVDLVPISASNQITFIPPANQQNYEPLKSNFNSERKQQPLPPELTRSQVAPKRPTPAPAPRQNYQQQTTKQAMPQQAPAREVTADTNGFALELTFGNIEMRFKHLPKKISSEEANSISFY